MVLPGFAPNVPNTDFAVARLNPDGSLDGTFGTGGRLTVPFDLGAGDKSDTASAALVQPDGRIVVAGSAEVRGTVNLHGNTPGRDFAAARLNPDGSLDKSFGGTGKVTVTFGQPDSPANAAFLQPDGRIVLAGSAGFDAIFNGVSSFRNPNFTSSPLGRAGTSRP